MIKFQNKYRIETTRLSGYDYSQSGAYFITICTKDRECLFGEIVDGKMLLNDFGKIVNECWYDLPKHYHYLILDEFIIMPNHIHGIMIINNDENNDNIVVETGNAGLVVETGLRPVSTTNTNTYTFTNTYSNTNTDKTINSTKMNHGISEFVRALKSFSSRKINEIRKTKYPPIWQTRFYEHIIRNEKELQTIRNYIINNPIKWDIDKNFRNNL